MSERFYVAGPLSAGRVVLHGDEAHHLVVVCRLKAGAAVQLFNGDGREYLAVVAEAGKKAVALDVGPGESPSRERAIRLELAVPLPKGDRAQFLIEKATELGVARLVPLRTARSIVHAGDSKPERWQRWVIEASKQCGRNVLMEVGPLMDLDEVIERADLPARRWLAHPGGGPVDRSATGDMVVAVGPEGGFTEAEVERAVGAGWRTVGLGPSILRVETAALALASVVLVG